MESQTRITNSPISELTRKGWIIKRVIRNNLNVSSHNRSIDYDNVKDVYDCVRVGNPEMVHQLLSGASLKPDSLVLDVGCGTANNTLLFREVARTRMVGIDLSIGMLQKAIEKSREILFIHSPAENLPFKEDTFDFIFMTEVVHHLTNVNASISEIYRILKPDCTFCIATQSHKQIEHRMTSRFFPATVPVDKARYPRIIALEDMQREIGFENVHSKSFEFAPEELGTDYLQTVEKRGYSMLHKISDEDYKSGVSQLKAAFSSGEVHLYIAKYTFVWARK